MNYHVSLANPYIIEPPLPYAPHVDHLGGQGGECVGHYEYSLSHISTLHHYYYVIMVVKFFEQ